MQSVRQDSLFRRGEDRTRWHQVPQAVLQVQCLQQVARQQHYGVNFLMLGGIGQYSLLQK